MNPDQGMTYTEIPIPDDLVDTSKAVAGSGLMEVAAEYDDKLDGKYFEDLIHWVSKTGGSVETGSHR